MDQSDFAEEQVHQAYDLLLQKRLVEIEKPLNASSDRGKSGWGFSFWVEVPAQNPAGIQSPVLLMAHMDRQFPFSPVNIVPLSEVDPRGFPHQDAETGKLCLPEKGRAPSDFKRLVTYVQWAIEWLHDASQGTLLKPGEPYELPDFSRKTLKGPLQIKQPVLFQESNLSYENWKDRIGTWGRVELAIGERVDGLLALRFEDHERGEIAKASYSPGVLDSRRRLSGYWLLLKDITFRRHRPPQTFEELQQVCARQGIQVLPILKECWAADNPDPRLGILLIGFAIPRNVSEEPLEIHWQPLFLPTFRSDRHVAKRETGKHLKQRKLWERILKGGGFAGASQLHWGKSINVHHERLYARGALSQYLRSQKVVLVGCGAIGGCVAQLLARGGIGNLTLLDPDILNVDNQCRHCLDGRDHNENKATALASHLQSVNPCSHIAGYATSVPIADNAQEEVRDAINAASLIVDCTANESAFAYLNHFAVKTDKTLVSLFVNFGASLLSLAWSGLNHSCQQSFEKLFEEVSKGVLSVDAATYFKIPTKEEQILPGAGCWHATFPARGSQIWLLASTAVELINQYLSDNSQAFATLLRRDDLADFRSTAIERVWQWRQ